MGNKYRRIPCDRCGGEVAKQDRSSGVIIPEIKPFKVVGGKPFVKCKNCNKFIPIKPEPGDSYNPLSLPKK
jgi:hypothetical protein